MNYVDGYVLVVPNKNLATYTKMAKLASKVWKDHGALQYVECTGEDLKPPFGLPFTSLTKAKKNETVIFSFIVFKSRAHRDKVNAKVMKDKRLEASCDPDNMPFDMKRMSYGGFKAIVEA